MEKNKILRIYCSGVYDMCHLGHMKSFEKIYHYCKEHFNTDFKIVVGLHSDAVVESYKRKPIINEKIRYETVKYCKYVDEIIENAPLKTTHEFIDKHNIDCIALNKEYRYNNFFVDKDVIESTVHFYITRFDSISSTEIINLCKNV